MPDPAAPLLATSGCTVRFPGTDAPSLVLPALSIAPGARVLLTGPTGSGKTTLWLLLAGLLTTESVEAPAEVTLLGDPLTLTSAAQMGRHLGAVFQSPADQLLAMTCAEEVALGLRPLGWSEALITARVADALAQVGLGGFAMQTPALLSGGQQQRLALAAALARRPAWLLLDEPFSQLDPPGAQSLARLLEQITSETGCGLVIAEHRHDLALPCVDRVLALEAGTVVADVPASGARSILQAPTLPPVSPAVTNSASIVELREAEVRYDRAGAIAFAGSLRIPGQGITVVIGANGSGKSTLLALLTEELQPSAGELHWATATPMRRVSLVPQQSDFRLLGRTIRADLAFAGAGSGEIASIASRLRLPPLDQAPLTASRGERLRIALAGALLEAPSLLLLDEPTTGQDADALARFVTILAELSMPVVLSTHDLALAGAIASTVIVLRAGHVLAVGDRAVLQDPALLQAAGLSGDRDA